MGVTNLLSATATCWDDATAVSPAILARGTRWGSADALGFDDDGARFSYIGALVTFEVLMVSFELTEMPGCAASLAP